ncbi:MAG: hypothetical protein L6408_03785 [Nanoarchaeota archaeon]|nr:hypothetical protein [Nanoarchaeota archaeon]
MKLNKLKYLINILEQIEDNPEKLPDDVIEKYSPEMHSFFSQFCLGGKNPYVNDMNGVLKLTQEGIRKLDELRLRLDQIEHQKKQTSINKLIALTGSALATTALYGLISDYNWNQPFTIDGVIGAIFGTFLLILLGFILVETWGLMFKAEDSKKF